MENLTREDIQNMLGCRIMWHTSSLRNNVRIQARFVPLAGLQQLVFHWNQHGWGWWPKVDIRTAKAKYFKHGLRTINQLGQYDRIYVDRAGGFLYHPFHASRTHYLCQHWLDPLPAELGNIFYDRQYELRPMRLIDIVVKGQLVLSPTLQQITDHFVGGTQGDWNYPFPRLIKYWQENRLS